MRCLRRALAVVFAIAAAIGIALIFVPAAALFDPVARAAVIALIELAPAVFAGEDAAEDTLALISFAWTAALAICAVPIIAVALLGEIARVRTIFWYAIATGCGAASAPWLVRAALHLPRVADHNSAETRLTWIFFFAGVVSGSVYWLLAGRDAHEGATC